MSFTKKIKRIFIIVLDSLGAGALPDADRFGDKGAFTLSSIYKTGKLDIPNLVSLGIGNIEGLDFLGTTSAPKAAYGRMAELSNGKDTTIGHWEIAGIVSKEPFPTYKDGFPKEILDEFTRLTGKKVLCNKPYSGTDVIRDYGEEHIGSGDLIVYTSADSVFQIAAHEDIIPLEKLYEYCKIARGILCGKHSVGRVIARPFTGTPGNFKRTGSRRDFSIEPSGRTMLDALKDSEKDVISVGKISDIFASKGITDSNPTHSNAEGMIASLDISKRDFEGLCFINLVDFDSNYGHRNDATGYAHALNEFDRYLPQLIAELKEEDMLIITADHGCDPGDISTDHTREYVPLLVYGKNVKPISLGTRKCFCDIAATVCKLLGVSYDCRGADFSTEVL